MSKFNKKYQCPVRDEYTLDVRREWDDCLNCGWEDERLQADEPDCSGGANEMSLNEARKAYRESRKVE